MPNVEVIVHAVEEKEEKVSVWLDNAATKLVRLLHMDTTKNANFEYIN